MNTIEIRQQILFPHHVKYEMNVVPMFSRDHKKKRLNLSMEFDTRKIQNIIILNECDKTWEK